MLASCFQAFLKKILNLDVGMQNFNIWEKKCFTPLHYCFTFALPPLKILLSIIKKHLQVP